MRASFLFVWVKLRVVMMNERPVKSKHFLPVAESGDFHDCQAQGALPSPWRPESYFQIPLRSPTYNQHQNSIWLSVKYCDSVSNATSCWQLSASIQFMFWSLDSCSTFSLNFDVYSFHFDTLIIQTSEWFNYWRITPFIFRGIAFFKDTFRHTTSSGSRHVAFATSRRAAF